METAEKLADHLLALVGLGFVFGGVNVVLVDYVLACFRWTFPRMLPSLRLLRMFGVGCWLLSGCGDCPQAAAQRDQPTQIHGRSCHQLMNQRFPFAPVARVPAAITVHQFAELSLDL